MPERTLPDYDNPTRSRNVDGIRLCNVAMGSPALRRILERNKGRLPEVRSDTFRSVSLTSNSTLSHPGAVFEFAGPMPGSEYQSKQTLFRFKSKSVLSQLETTESDRTVLALRRTQARI